MGESKVKTSNGAEVELEKAIAFIRARDLALAVAKEHKSPEAMKLYKSLREQLSKSDVFMEHARAWLDESGLMDDDEEDGIYDGMLGRAVLKMCEGFAAEGHSGFSASIARMAFNAICDEFEGRRTITMEKRAFEKYIIPAYQQYKSDLQQEGLQERLNSAAELVELYEEIQRWEYGWDLSDFEAALPAVMGFAKRIEESPSEPLDKASQLIDKAMGKHVSLHKSDTEERIAYGEVLVPDEYDSQEDIYTVEDVRLAAHRFLELYKGRTGLQHREIGINDRVKVLESYLAPVDFELEGRQIKKGTWLMCVRVLDDTLWEAVKNGDITGFSIGGDGVRTPVSNVA